MPLRHQRGYIDPSPFGEKKLGNLSARVPLQVVEDIEAFAKEHRLKRAEVVRMCIENTLYRDDKRNHALLNQIQSTNPMKARHYRNESSGIRGLFQLIGTFLQTQKNPEVRVQDLIAQHHKGH